MKQSSLYPRPRSKVRILYVLPGNLGGITTGFLEIFQYLNLKKFQPTILLTKRDALKWFKMLGIHCCTVSRKSPERLIENLIRRKKIHLVQCCDATFQGALAAYRAGVPNVWFIGGSLKTTFKDSIKKPDALSAVIDRLSRLIVVPTKVIQKEEFSETGTWKKIRVIPWGISGEARRCQRREEGLKKRLGVPLSSPLVAMVGNFYPAKRHLDFLRAAFQIRRKMPQVHFVIGGRAIGPKGYFLKIQKTIRRLQMEEIVNVVPFSYGDRHGWYPEIDVLLCASHEGMGQAILEAAMNKVPIVAANVGGVPEVLEHNFSCLLVPFANPNAMAKAALRLLASPRLSRRLARHAFSQVQKKFGARQQARRFEKLYLEVLNSEAASKKELLRRKS